MRSGYAAWCERDAVCNLIGQSIRDDADEVGREAFRVFQQCLCLVGMQGMKDAAAVAGQLSLFYLGRISPLSPHKRWGENVFNGMLACRFGSRTRNVSCSPWYFCSGDIVASACMEMPLSICPHTTLH